MTGLYDLQLYNLWIIVKSEFKMLWHVVELQGWIYPVSEGEVEIGTEHVRVWLWDGQPGFDSWQG
jgi:hypothetical protein